MTWQERASKHLIRYAGSFSPILVAQARGATLWDTEGHTYLDFSSGQVCATIGHNHPRVNVALQQPSRA
jgi:2,2-dialkylglycine decarboxylase (pyruvate)